MKKIVPFFKKAVMWSASVAVVSSIVAFSVSTSTVVAVNPEVIDNTPKKIAALKADLIQRLSVCENISQNPGLIIFDNNSSGTLTGQRIPSIGLLMFKIGTVKDGYKLFHGQTISDMEAVQIAMDKEKAFALAEEIIFSGGDKKGIGHWYYCSNKLGLAAEVSFIKKLEL